ncbi:class I SAM-dependent methyltransferase [Chryseobacterium caseinilyticum]|uniref:Class I SAM-dependent methyltransferase n=1 Tax=Chryseobacterium caseinilyticum TaxID=2771428 RepID=A0ABR8ZGT3_9FLAO|nr:class I SAM-dependent methyltransferase [Chryseobacterium caseinilyticum]MBD8084299.1 class I SAM-dependent methyltransferase [Chryseobacterium caseinilyticum]
MTWEETIQYIRTKPEYKFLVEKAYFEEDLSLNVERFRESSEYHETLKEIKKYAPSAKKILDIGSGNGITCIALALDGYDVTTVEPDSSDTIGAGAIRKLKELYHLQNIKIYEAFAEEIKFPDGEFDIVYARQCMHHAYHLQKFVGEMSRVLRKDGLFFTVRDHVIYDEKDKQWFLENHPLQKYYGGENAFTSDEYKHAINKAGLDLQKEMKFFDSEINFFPETPESIVERKRIFDNTIKSKLYYKIFSAKKNSKINDMLTDSEKLIPGRMYSYVAIKR